MDYIIQYSYVYIYIYVYVYVYTYIYVIRNISYMIDYSNYT